jgi:hypothetical protein
MKENGEPDCVDDDPETESAEGPAGTTVNREGREGQDGTAGAPEVRA